MQAWRARQYGEAAKALRLDEIARPEPAADEVLIRVQAASLNPIDVKLLQGALRRLFEVRFPVTVGFDASGVIEAVGADVGDFRPGDAVYVRASRETLGAFAEFSCQPARFVAKRPSNLDAVAAASFPLVALTTVQGLVDRAKLRPGQRILIHAGSGGLGSFAIQYAKQMGLQVDTTTSLRNADWVGELGADRVICYDREDYRTQGAVYDAVLDAIGGAQTLDAFAVLKAGGAVISVAGPPDREMIAKFGGNAFKRLAMRSLARKVEAAARAKGARYFRYLTESNGAQLAALVPWLEQGRIRPVIDHVFAFEQCVEAYEYLATGRARGKVMLRMPE